MTWHVNIRWPFVITAGDGWLEEIGVQSDWSRLQFRFLAASTCVRLGLLIFGVPSTYFPQKKNGEEESRKKVLLSYFTFDFTTNTVLSFRIFWLVKTSRVYMFSDRRLNNCSAYTLNSLFLLFLIRNLIVAYSQSVRSVMKNQLCQQ